MSTERLSSPKPIRSPSTATSLLGTLSVAALRAHGDEPLASSSQPLQKSRAFPTDLSSVWSLEEVSIMGV